MSFVSEESAGKSIVAGVDIGGSHITVGLIDAKQHILLETTVRRRKINAGNSAEKIIGEWVEEISACFAGYKLKPTRIGIAMPGPFDYKNGIALMKNQDKYDQLYGLNVKNLLANRLGIASSQIVFVNDAACFLQGEVFSGLSAAGKNILGITLGTGLGSAKRIDGKTEDADLWRYPYKDGIAEDYLSGRWFIKRYKQLTDESIHDVKHLVDCMDSEFNSAAATIFNEFGQNLAEFLSLYIRKFNIEVIVLGGNISKSFEYFSPALLHALKLQFPRIEVLKSELGEHAALLGAASYSINSKIPV